jgi:hypothetical protein
MGRYRGFLVVYKVNNKYSLSPLLFVLVMKILSQMLSTMEESGQLSRFFMGSRCQEAMIVSHLLFADDTLIFCEPNVEQFRNLRCLLLCFEAVSGMKINLSKFEIVLVGDVGDVEELVSILGCGVASLPIKCLGIPLGAKYKDSNIWKQALLRRCKIDWRGGRDCIYQMVGG